MNATPMDQPQPQQGYNLSVPFVATRSHSGPYDDASFVAGYQCGEIARALHVAAALNTAKATLRFTVRTDTVRQLELLAMHAGFPYMATGPAGDDHPEWTAVTFSNGWPSDAA